MQKHYSDYLKDDLNLTDKQVKVIQKAYKGIFPKDVKSFLDALPHQPGKIANNSQDITKFLTDKYGQLMAEVFMCAVYFYIQPDELGFMRNLIAIKQNERSLTN
jgi:hypothetical protein